MTESKLTVGLAGIQDIVRQIVDRFHPEKVILFGSHAGGTPTEDSDVDLLVVMETDENPLRTAGRIAAAIEHPFPLDVLVFRPSQLTASLKRKGVFATDVSTRGILFYEARNDRVSG